MFEYLPSLNLIELKETVEELKFVEMIHQFVGITLDCEPDFSLLNNFLYLLKLA